MRLSENNQLLVLTTLCITLSHISPPVLDYFTMSTPRHYIPYFMTVYYDDITVATVALIFGGHK